MKTRLVSSAIYTALLLANGMELKANEGFLLNKVKGTNNSDHPLQIRIL